MDIILDIYAMDIHCMCTTIYYHYVSQSVYFLCVMCIVAKLGYSMKYESYRMVEIYYKPTS